jgi:hypothetical protein
MTWNLSGELIETCSCNMLCPCWFGQADLMLMDKGWCATSLLLRIREGSFDGTDLAGQNAVVNFHFPGPTLFDANGTARVHIDESASDAQRAAIETILQGQSGGGMEVPASLVSNWLPSKTVSISVSDSDGKIAASVSGVGEMVSRRLVNDLGNRMTMHNSAFSVAFQHDDHVGDLAPSDGTSWKDADMPEAWEGKSGVAGQVSWSG